MCWFSLDLECQSSAGGDVGCVWEDLKSHTCFRWLVFQFCWADRSETITNKLICFFFFFWEMFEKQFWSGLWYLCLQQIQPVQYNYSHTLCSPAPNNSKLLFRLRSQTLTSYRAFVCVASSVLLCRRIFSVTVELLMLLLYSWNTNCWTDLDKIAW